MSLFHVTVEGLEELEREWAEAQRALSDGLREGVRKGVNEGAEVARATHRFKNRTGEAENQTQGVMVGSTPGAAIGELVCLVPYASFLSDGFKTWQPDPFLANGMLKAERVVVREVEIAAARAESIMSR